MHKHTHCADQKDQQKKHSSLMSSPMSPSARMFSPLWCQNLMWRTQPVQFLLFKRVAVNQVFFWQGRTLSKWFFATTLAQSEDKLSWTWTVSKGALTRAVSHAFQLILILNWQLVIITFLCLHLRFPCACDQTVCSICSSKRKRDTCPCHSNALRPGFTCCHQSLSQQSEVYLCGSLWFTSSTHYHVPFSK